MGLLAISLGVSLVVVDFTIVNVIIPPIVEDLDISSLDAQWIQESYAIALAALLLVMGRLSDIWGARRLFLLGTLLFGVASIAAALAPNGDVLIAARLVQGIGGSIVMPTSLALLNYTFQGPDRGKAFAIWGSTIGAAAAVGPLLGGWLGEISWRWAFGINIVVIAMIVAGVMKYLTEAHTQRAALDVLGAVLSVVGLGLLAFGLIEGRNYGWWESTRESGPLGISFGDLSVIPVALAVSAVALVLFLLHQARLTRTRSPEPLMDTQLFSIRSFSTGNLATLIIGLAEFGILAVLPLWLQFTLGYSTLQTGLMIAVVAIGSFFASGASFGMAEKTSPVRLVQIGLVLEALGLLVFAVLARSDSSWWIIAIGLFLYGTGVGFATAQVTNVVLVDVPPRKAGQGSGIQSASRQLGSALGIAVLTTTFFSVLASSTVDRLKDSGAPAGAAEELGKAVGDSAGAAIPALAADPNTASAADAAREAMTYGVQINGYTCAALLFLGLLATFLIPKTAAARPSAEADPAEAGAGREAGTPTA
ncbi:DHA2 family efflux MFS transporter permease subunit [Kineosporia rhizophila]|uniref:DHA2 family efflux MFS transporter permease subunit n=1 Tax=Kineosporia TaxID=49184 RepID=UPI001E60D8F6|nr:MULTISPECIES: DHA2 family efflux MFS transporter permease subunit [Kineosporia]MCE0537643.1 DHA2 family efflux MFS transporter permease subunit [Kineosporia rhizophila]GLY18842.1 MFS transporter [Kineosporia sp. NBRC 101677]